MDSPRFFPRDSFLTLPRHILSRLRFFSKSHFPQRYFLLGVNFFLEQQQQQRSSQIASSWVAMWHPKLSPGYFFLQTHVFSGSGPPFSRSHVLLFEPAPFQVQCSSFQTNLFSLGSISFRTSHFSLDYSSLWAEPTSPNYRLLFGLAHFLSKLSQKYLSITYQVVPRDNLLRHP